MRKMLALSTVVLAVGCSKVLPPAMERTPPGPPSPDTMAWLWVDPGDIASRDLFHGAGGERWQPAPGTTFQFVEKDTAGFSPGFDVRDASGVPWSTKHGLEAQSEVAVSRLLWAIGYHQPPTYYVESWRLSGHTDVPQPSRFRPLPPGWKTAGAWSLRQNPFVGTTPYNGLLGFMRIVNNWDLLDRNTQIYDLPAPQDGAQRWYVVKDLGASLGRTRIVPDSGTRNDIEDFERQGFIDGVNDEGFVEWDDLGRWHRDLFDEIPAADLVWVAERLDRLTDEQWQDAFRAAGYERPIADRFIRKIRGNVAAGLALRP